MRNRIFTQLARLLIGVLLFTVCFSNIAFARIIFQDDSFHDIVSEGLIINSNDGGDEDVTLQLGNDSTDSTITFDDGTGDTTFATPGGDYSFSDDNITTTGDLSVASGTFSGVFTSNGTVNLGDGGDNVTINSSVWDISSAGAVTGLTGIVSTGVLNFSGTSEFRMRENSDPASNSACTTLNELIVDTTDNQVQICTATGGAGAATWASISGSSQDFESVYSTDGDNTLTTSGGSFSIAAGSGAVASDSQTLSIDSVDTTNISMTASDTSDKTFTISATNGGSGSGLLVLSTDTWDITASGAVSGFTTLDTYGDITTSTGDFIVGTTGLSETNGSGDNGASLVGTDQSEFANSSSTTVQDVLDDFDALIGAGAENVEQISFEPEYPNAVVYQDGADNKGLIEALYDNTNRENYYSFTTNNASIQDMDIRFRYELPTDFDDAGNLTIRLRTNSTSTAVNSAQIIIRNDTDNATCHTDTATASSVADTWETITITGAEIDTGCSGGDLLAASDVIEIQLHLSATSASSGTDIGTIDFAYTN